MQKACNPYQVFNHFVLRTPLFSFQFYQKIIQEKSVQEVWNDPLVQEILLLTSPDLFQLLQKNEENTTQDLSKKSQKLEDTLLKYLIRSSTRCTPFGLFAGCSVGTFDTLSAIELEEIKRSSKSTHYDMTFISSLFSHLNKLEIVRKQACFYPNTSLFLVKDQYRYLETSLEKDTRSYSVEGVFHSVYIEKLLQKAEKGSTFQELIQVLIEDEITEAEARDFVNLLIDNQLLVSELSLSVVGDDPLTELAQVLNRFKGVEIYQNFVKELQQGLHTLDQEISVGEQPYKEIEKSIRQQGISYHRQYLFQTDWYPKAKTATLAEEHQKKLKKVLHLFNSFSNQSSRSNLKQFQEAFVKRYETREIPLLKVLDVESGINYPVDRSFSNVTPFLEGIEKQETVDSSTVELNEFQQKLLKRVQQAHQNKVYTLEISDQDIEQKTLNWEDLPTTMASLVEVVRLEGKEQLVVSHIGGSTGANLLGRFTHGNKTLKTHVETIVTKDEAHEEGKIVAEIVHVPEARTGNILRRETIRKYEIPFLGKSNVPLEQQIRVQDLTVSVRHNRLVLWSQQHQKEVVPRLTNAHNYSGKGLPLYRFLCDMQFEGKRSSIGFSWGDLKNLYTFLPRVVYQEVIISKASWQGKRSDIQVLYDLLETELMDKVKEWRNRYQVPRYVQLVERDQTLLLDLENLKMIQLGLEEVKNKERLVLEEFLFTEEIVVKRKEEGFTNQVVVSFYKGNDNELEMSNE